MRILLLVDSASKAVVSASTAFREDSLPGDPPPGTEFAVIEAESLEAAFEGGAAFDCVYDPVQGRCSRVANTYLAIKKEQAKLAIDHTAEKARLRHISPGAGQALVYENKRRAAERYLAVGGEVSAYPLLACDLGVNGETLGEVAAVILAAADAWEQVGGAIEGVRLSSKRDVEAATNVGAVEALVASAVSSLEAL